jgi:hypothetical protein
VLTALGALELASEVEPGVTGAADGATTGGDGVTLSGGATEVGWLGAAVVDCDVRGCPPEPSVHADRSPARKNTEVTGLRRTWGLGALSWGLRLAGIDVYPPSPERVPPNSGAPKLSVGEPNIVISDAKS